MEKKDFKKLLFSFITSFLFITICSKNSFLYPMNDWGDVNCFFTVGRSLLDGKVLYRDIYEQKGPLLYFIYAVLSFISKTSFVPIYLFEVITFAIFLYYASKCITLYINNDNLNVLGIVILAFITVISKPFANGGSVEELMLFMQMYSIYVFLKLIKNEEQPNQKECFFIGIFCACAFWIKYLTCSFYLGLVLYILYYYCYKTKAYKTLFTSIKYFLFGFATITIIPFIYFIYHQALFDLFTVYFYNNLFLYSAKVPIWLSILYVINKNIKSYFFVLWILGFVYLYKNKLREKYFITFLFILTFILTYASGKIFFAYYCLVLIPFTIFGIIFLLKILSNVKINKIIIIGIAFLFCIASYCFSQNTYLMKYKKDDLPQYKFAKIMEDANAKTMLYYGHLDKGFYYTSEITPNCKYFCRLNIQLKEMKNMQKEFIESGKTDFVITDDKTLDEYQMNTDHYELISKEEFTFDKKDCTYYLYKLKK